MQDFVRVADFGNSKYTNLQTTPEHIASKVSSKLLVAKGCLATNLVGDAGDQPPPLEQP